jgi:hypothetical protein
MSCVVCRMSYVIHTFSIHTYTHTHIHTYTHTHIHTYTQTHKTHTQTENVGLHFFILCICPYVLMSLCHTVTTYSRNNVCIYAYAYICLCLHMPTCLQKARRKYKMLLAAFDHVAPLQPLLPLSPLHTHIMCVCPLPPLSTYACQKCFLFSFFPSRAHPRGHCCGCLCLCSD